MYIIYYYVFPATIITFAISLLIIGLDYISSRMASYGALAALLKVSFIILVLVWVCSLFLLLGVI